MGALEPAGGFEPPSRTGLKAAAKMPFLLKKIISRASLSF
jgi:hypothetical protein